MRRGTCCRPCRAGAGAEPAPGSVGAMAAMALDTLEEGDEEEASDEEDEGVAEGADEEMGSTSGNRSPGDVPVSFTTADIPQAFSCFSYRFSARKFLVCDLQGVLDETSSPMCFELTDPVIHYRSDTVGWSSLKSGMKAPDLALETGIV